MFSWERIHEDQTRSAFENLFACVKMKAKF